MEIRFKNVLFRGLTRKILFEEDSFLKIIVTVNSEFIVLANKDPEFNKLIAENFGTFDGQIPYKLARCKFRDVSFEKISGSDLVYDICEFSRNNNKRVFLLGGNSDSNLKSISVLQEKYHIQISGFSPQYMPYPFDIQHNEMILEEIQNFKPDFLLVGFGAKKQEMWINDHKDQLSEMGVKWAVGVGGTFEFVAGTIKRAPLIVQRAGLEGFYRFIQEPKLFRLKRLITSLAIFAID